MVMCILPQTSSQVSFGHRLAVLLQKTIGYLTEYTILLPMSVPFLLHYPDNLTNVDDQVAAPIWRRTVDKRVIAHREEHEEYLKTIGFFGSN